MVYWQSACAVRPKDWYDGEMECTKKTPVLSLDRLHCECQQRAALSYNSYIIDTESDSKRNQ